MRLASLRTSFPPLTAALQCSAVCALICLTAISLAAPALGSDGVRRARSIDASELGVSGPVGVGWSRRADALLVATPSDVGVVDRDAPPRAHRAAGRRRPAGPRRTLGLAFADPLLVGFDNRFQRLVAYDARGRRLVVVPAGADGVPVAGRREVFPARRLGVVDAEGLTVDPVSGRIYLLDGAGPRLLVVEPDADGRLRQASVQEVALEVPDAVRGLAFDPSSGHVHVLAPASGRLYEVDAAGTLVANRDLSGLGLQAPQGMVFAPSGDGTDDPAQQSLYVVEAGAAPDGGIAELSLAAVAEPAAAVTTVSAVLVQRIPTSQYDPPSPDSMGIAYIDASDTLLMSDSEVNEIASMFTGVNLFEIDYRNGQLLATASTLEPQAFSTEPVGLAYDPVTNHVFVSHDDGGGHLFVVDAGSDGHFFTNDDSIREVSTGSFGNQDCEGITFDRNQRVLYTTDGVDSEVYRIDPGSDGLYGTSDDATSHFDTAGYGLSDPEGITYDPFSGNLYVGAGANEDLVIEVTPQGQLVRYIDVSDANMPDPSGLGYGPGSQNPSLYSLYVTDRGTDNDSVSWPPGENDGQLFELSFQSASPGNNPPVVDAGPNLSVTLPDTVFLDATVTDDPSQTLSYQWTKVSGPGSVGFGSPNAEDTTASFTAAGSYVLQLAAQDGELSGSDQVTVTVSSPGGGSALDVRVATGSDDAEETVSSGSVSLNSSDLELILDHEDQVVGMRFTGLAIPPGASIVDAWIQFQVDETDSVATSLTFRGQRIANAPTFTSSTGNVSTRTPTGAFTAWSPPAWTQTGAAGAGQRTPSLAGIVSEIVGLPGWASGNAMVFLVTGSGTRTAESFNGDAAGAPLLHVEFSTQANDPPSVSLNQPSDGASFAEGQTIGFSGSASDPEDGNLTSSLAWSSSLDGPIGSGGSFSRSDLSPGTHTLTASVTDSGGQSASQQVQITVVASPSNTPPQVNISAPANGSSFSEGTSVSFSASANDAEDGSLTSSLAWNSSLDGSIGSGASFSTASLSVGSHVITASVTDSGGLSDTAQISISILPDGGGAPTVTEVRVSAGSDDAEETLSSGSVSLNSSDLELILDHSDQVVGMRFDGVGVPQGAAILGAWVQFQVDETDSTATSLTIRGQASDAAATFTSSAGNVSGRPTTAASVAWSPPAWTSTGQAGPAQRTPDLGPIIQEIVSRPGWVSGNPLVLIVTGSGTRTAESFNGDSSGAPLLHVEYSVAGGTPNDPPTVSLEAPGNGASFDSGQAILFQGTADDTEDGNLTGSLSWSSSLDGPIGSGGSFTRSDLSGGSHVITASVTDSGGRTTSEQVTIQVAGPAGGSVLDIQVAAGTDDAEEDVASGAVSLNSSDLELIFDHADQVVGMRFSGVAIPRGAPIQTAWVQFQVDETDSATTSVTIRGQAADDAATFQSSTGNVSLRPTTSAATAWAPPAWQTVGEAGPDQRTPELGAVIQEIVNRPGWAPGNALVLVVRGTGTRTAESFNGDAAGAPVLHVEFGSP